MGGESEAESRAATTGREDEVIFPKRAGFGGSPNFISRLMRCVTVPTHKSHRNKGPCATLTE